METAIETSYLAPARYGAARTQEHFLSMLSRLGPYQRVVLQTARGTELGLISGPARPLPPGAPPPPAGKVLRRATLEDLKKQAELDTASRTSITRTCEELIERHRLPMHLVLVEQVLGGERIYFYFESETRVDFRALVRDLAREFQTRIELRQIGPREEARLTGDFQNCGQPLCCRAFLRRLDPIPMSLARIQKQSLDPGKISGACGKLKCCLRFEEAVYADLRVGLPPRGSLVATAEAAGTVVGADVYNRRLIVETLDRTRLIVSFSDLLIIQPAREERGEEQYEGRNRDSASRVMPSARNEEDGARPSDVSTRIAPPASPPQEPATPDDGPPPDDPKNGPRSA